MFFTMAILCHVTFYNAQTRNQSKIYPSETTMKEFATTNFGIKIIWLDHFLDGIRSTPSLTRVLDNVVVVTTHHFFDINKLSFP